MTIDKKWGKTSQCGRLEKIMNINSNGESEWWGVKELEKQLPDIRIAGNGSPLFNNNRGLGLLYKIEKKRESKNGIIIEEYGSKPKKGKIIAIRTIGILKSKGYGTPSSSTLKTIKSSRCCYCGSRAKIEIDHKNSRLDYIGVLPLSEFQPLCSHCNDVKRERCLSCKNTNQRYDAKKLGYRVSYTIGNKEYDIKNGCNGCIWNDPIKFRRQLLLCDTEIPDEVLKFE
jgi:hypothetical protein